MSLLENIKKSMRILNSSLYDDEIQMCIDYVKNELARHGVMMDDSDSRLFHLCGFYAKSVMGNGKPDEKAIWFKRFNETMCQVITDNRLSGD